MKKLIAAGCLALCALNLHARGIRDEVNLATESAKVSYAFGMMLGTELSGSGLELNYSRFTEGLRDTMENLQTKLTEEEAVEAVQKAFQAAEARLNEESRIKESLFFAENGTRDAVITTPSGLQYEVLTEGSGPKPAADDVARVHYEGAMVDGTVFDSSYNQEKPADLPLDGVIPGISEGLQLMSPGGKYRFYIPSALAYGAHGVSGMIPPYATLIFTVELLEINPPDDSQPDEAAQGE